MGKSKATYHHDVLVSVYSCAKCGRDFEGKQAKIACRLHSKKCRGTLQETAINYADAQEQREIWEQTYNKSCVEKIIRIC